MVKHTQTIRRKFAEEFLSVFGHFVAFAIKGLMSSRMLIINAIIIIKVFQRFQRV